MLDISVVFNFRVVEKLQQKKHIVRYVLFSRFPQVLLFVFSRETCNAMAWDRLPQPTWKYRSIHHMEYPKFQTRIFGRMESTLGQTIFLLSRSRKRATPFW